MTSTATRKSTSSPASEAGPMQLDLLAGLTPAPCGPDPAPVSRSRSRAKAPELLMNGICGPTFTDSSQPAGPLSSWENRLRERLAMVGSTESALIWREKITPAGESIFRLAPWTPPTSGAGSIGSRKPWSTPMATDGEKGGPNQSFGAGGQPLPAQMHQSMWPTPKASTAGETSRSGDRKDEPLMGGLMRGIADKSTWVTPSARDWKDSAGMATQAGDRNRIDQLPRQMCAQTAPSGPTPSGSPVMTAKRGAPNPAFPCWLMGYPAEWLLGAVSAMQSPPRSRQR